MKASSLALCTPLLLVGACSHIELAARSDSRPPVSSAGASLQVQGRSGFAALLFGGMLIAGAAGDQRNSPPQMEKDRVVSEQDCTRPIEPGDNLRCR